MRNATWSRGRLRVVAGAGYVGFAVGALVSLWLARLNWNPYSDENPLVLLPLIWIVAGLCHMFVRQFGLAWIISTIVCGLGYVVLCVVALPDAFANEMFGVGVLLAAVAGALGSLLMGAPVVVYRRALRALSEPRSEEQS